MNLYRRCVRPILFRFDPEWIHSATLRASGVLGRARAGRAAIEALYGFEHPRLRTRVAGIDFPNPLGLPAGFDKNGIATQALAALGFGSVDIGSISALPSAGNPVRPRLFRLPMDEGVMVYYGVPNEGAQAVARRLAGATGGEASVRRPVPLGVSLVETNTGIQAGLEHVITEMVQAARPFLAIADYLVLNLNCPNSSGGVSHFDDPAKLRQLLQAFRGIAGLGPVFLRITPPRDPALIDALLVAIDPFSFVKALAFYTFPADLQARLRTPKAQLQRMRGSFSGPPNRDAAEGAIRQWYPRIDRSRLALIGVGGVSSAQDAYRSIRLGASLVQIYTALIYCGPGVVKEIKQGLARLLERDGFTSVAEAVGVDNPPRREY